MCSQVWTDHVDTCGGRTITFQYTCVHVHTKSIKWIHSLFLILFLFYSMYLEVKQGFKISRIAALKEVFSDQLHVLYEQKSKRQYTASEYTVT